MWYFLVKKIRAMIKNGSRALKVVQKVLSFFLDIDLECSGLSVGGIGYLTPDLIFILLADFVVELKKQRKRNLFQH